MTDRRTPVKAAALLAPLILSVLGLHAWGDALAGGLGRAVSNWQYPERNHAIFQIRVPRRSDDVDAFAARALYDFVMAPTWASEPRPSRSRSYCSTRTRKSSGTAGSPPRG